MLEKLDQIDWYRFGHAYGDAADVPNMIRALTSADQSVRDEAWGNIFSSLRHQGDIYDSTPKAVPFLIELLDNDSVPGKAQLLEYFCYYSPDYEYRSFSDDESPATDEFKQQTRDAIEAGMPVYLRLLRDPDSAVRSWAARALTLCYRHREAVAAAIREPFPTEANPDVRTAWILQLGVLNRPTDTAFFADVASNDSEALVRFAAALTLVSVNSDAPPDEALRIIEESTKAPSDLIERLPKNEWTVDRAFDALQSRPDSYVKVLLQLLESPTVAVRKDAILKLHTLHPFPLEAIHALVRTLSDPVAEVRSWTAFLMGEVGDSHIQDSRFNRNIEILAKLESSLDVVAPTLVSSLIDRLATEEDQEVRAAICRAFKNLALWAEPAIPALCAEGNKRDAQAALTIIKSLRDDDPGAIFNLVVDIEYKVSWMAGRILLRIAKTNPDQIIPLLVSGLKSSPAAVEQSANLLGELGSVARAAIPELQTALGHEYQGARIAVAKALRAIAPDLPEPMSVPDEAAIRGQLGNDASTELVQLIKNLLNDSNMCVQLDALWKITQMGEQAKPAIPFVREAMAKSWLHYDAAGTLGRLDPEAVRPLIPDLLRRFQIAGLEGKFGYRAPLFVAYIGPELQPDAVRFLLSCLPEPGDEPRPAAKMIPSTLSQFRMIEPSVLLPLVIRLLETRWQNDDGALSSTKSILKFLKQHGMSYADATPAVLAKLQNNAAAPLVLETLSRIGSWSVVVPRLGPFLIAESETCKAAEECVQCLGKSATNDDLSALQMALAHESAVVRRSAVSAINRLQSSWGESRTKTNP